jgi:hypothetical protein
LQENVRKRMCFDIHKNKKYYMIYYPFEDLESRWPRVACAFGFFINNLIITEYGYIITYGIRGQNSKEGCQRAPKTAARC